jgi:hypothetical protein
VRCSSLADLGNLIWRQRVFATLVNPFTIADELRNNYAFADPSPRVVVDPTTKEIIDVLHQYGPNPTLLLPGAICQRTSSNRRLSADYLSICPISRLLVQVPISALPTARPGYGAEEMMLNESLSLSPVDGESSGLPAFMTSPRHRIISRHYGHGARGIVGRLISHTR